MNLPRPGLRMLAVTGSAVAAAAAFAAVGGATTAAVPPSNTSLPTISGTASQGSVLSASTGSWSGDPTITFTYQWQRCDSGGGSCANIVGATAQTYTLVLDDVNHTVLVVVTAHNGAGTGTASSAKTGVVLGATPPTNSALPTISGSGSVGSTLTTSNGTWGGNAPITYTYAWGRCNSSGAACAAIAGATAHTYTLVSADVGHTLRATVTATNAAGSGQATSGATAVIVVGAPVNTANPVVTGTAKEGQTLSATGGTWTGAAPITYTFQWWRCDTNGANCSTIANATAAAYKLTTADVGHAVRIRVTATNSAGSTSAVSDLTTQVASASGTTTTTTTTTTPPPSGTVKLPNGELSIPAANVPETDRLAVSSVKVSPSVIHGRSPVVITFKIVEANKYDVSGALVYVLGLPYGWAAKVPEAATGTDGTVAISVSPTAHAPKKGALVLFVRARTPHGSTLAGSSTRRLIQVKIRP
jgi:fibronectin type 3 domain-containing protein